MNIAVASGKGGTGKTTVSVSLALYMSLGGSSIALLDCDVEEPNVNLFLRAPIAKTENFSVLIPSIDHVLCTGCGECERICAYNAIAIIKGEPLVLADMCHSCGGCFHVCPEKAIIEIPKKIGVIESGSAHGIDFAGGRLNISAHMSPPLIKDMKKLHHDADVRIIDCPPGTSCPVIESVRGCDFLVLVTEPTPFGLNDLRLAVNMAKALSLPFGVVINRAGIGNDDVEKYCKKNDIEILARISNIKRIAEEYSRGDCSSYILDNYSNEFDRIVNHIMEKTAADVSL
ncbi:MAG: ATP-binding protein [Spirochaetes bacterium]|jgi:MinD superfamily P-loop ATPase|nr:ATP-binding protein [Spirochaetota bacterium]